MTLDQYEHVLVSVVEAGANRLDSASFGSDQLATLRRQARTAAVHAAQKKAQAYADAAGCTVGRVLHIEDVDPTSLRGREEHMTRSSLEDADPTSAIDPGAITVGGAVHVTFALEAGPTPSTRP